MLKNVNKCKKNCIFATIIFSSFVLPCTSNNFLSNYCSAEESTFSVENNFKPIVELSNNETILLSIDDNNIFLKKTDLNQDVWCKEFNLKNGVHFKNIKVIENCGFIIINNYCDNKLHLSSNELNIDNNVYTCENNYIYNLLAFDNNGELLLDEDTINYSNEYLDKFIEDVFSIKFYSFENELQLLTQEELIQKALELISLAEQSLAFNDIEQANIAINKIQDNEMKENLRIKLNTISKESINNEISNTTDENLVIDTSTSVLTSSEITLSVDTNNLTFDYLNVSEDTILYRAIALNVTSSLNYDVNMYIEGNIVSNTNNTNLKNEIFSVKESNSVSFKTLDDSGIVNVVTNSSPGNNTHYLDIKLNTGSNIIRDIYKCAFKIEAITK